MIEKTTILLPFVDFAMLLIKTRAARICFTLRLRDFPRPGTYIASWPTPLRIKKDCSNNQKVKTAQAQRR